jgi:hypothetical protein
MTKNNSNPLKGKDLIISSTELFYLRNNPIIATINSKVPLKVSSEKIYEQLKQ